MRKRYFFWWSPRSHVACVKKRVSSVVWNFPMIYRARTFQIASLTYILANTNRVQDVVIIMSNPWCNFTKSLFQSCPFVFLFIQSNVTKGTTVYQSEQCCASILFKSFRIYKKSCLYSMDSCLSRWLESTLKLFVWIRF